ncbi:PDZ domain-containing protein [Roseiterribacter gracilis]|uniref:PDZ domain-containing protein n=1 Tax=Roseiterribacter gracilis TaxID=2812848 RepID=A0A8S8XDK2_9PROT|nr:hypothetical protein TMPK1_21180 [Rhodospirillales bacterium TMPK1]
MTRTTDRFLRLAALLMAFWGFVLVALEAPSWIEQMTTGQSGSTGFGFQAEGGHLFSGRIVLTSIAEGGPADRAGLKVGDVAEIPVHTQYAPRPGLTVSLLVYRADGSSEMLTLPVDAIPEQFTLFVRRLLYVGFTLFLALAALVAWRGPSTLPSRLLALAFALYGQTSAYAYIDDDALRMAGQMSWTFSLSTAPLCLALFVVFYVRERTSGAGFRAPLRWTLLGICVLAASVLFSLFRLRLYMPHYMYATPQYGALLLVCTLVAQALWRGWSKAGGEDRQRFRWIAIATTAVLAGDLIGATPIPVWQSFLVIGLVSYVAKITGAILLVYALLRHRVIDFGFAINRATVFGATSLLLVGLFAACTALADRLLRFDDGAERNWIDIAITFVLAIAATRLRKLVEDWVERLLFQSWRAREQALRDFLQRAAHFTRPDPLLDGFAALLTQFAGADAAAILLQAPDGRFTSVRGDAAPLDVDAALTVELRATSGAVRWHGGLALPMRRGGALFGVVLLKPRANGEIYRPDEIELLAGAARQVGNDLQALQLVVRESDRFDSIVERLDRIESKLSPLSQTA